MGKIILTKCSFCHKSFGVEKYKYMLCDPLNTFLVDCPYCKEENEKYGMKGFFKE